MFSLLNQAAKLVNLNPRSEIHGPDKKLAADLKIEIKVSNDVLSEFHPSLKASLYQKADEAQGELIDEPGHLPALKYPLMGPISWGKEMAGYRAMIHLGITGQSDIELIDCEVDHFKFAPQDGGTVIVSFRIIAHPEGSQTGKLCEYIQQDISLSLIPPAEQAANDQQELLAA